MRAGRRGDARGIGAAVTASVDGGTGNNADGRGERRLVDHADYRHVEFHCAQRRRTRANPLGACRIAGRR